MKRVLFVCMGNIFRSQIAEAYYNFCTGCDYATSAGLHPGSHIHDTVKEAMLEVGIELSGNSKPLSKSSMDGADYIIAMDRRIPPEIPPQYAEKIILWDTPDTKPENGMEIREIRDFIIGRVENLLEEG